MRGDFKAGDTLMERYQIESVLGKGGTSKVYLCRDTRLDVQVAVKILLRAYRKNPDVVKRFLREAKVQAKLKHPNIVHVTNVENRDGITIMVMEYLKGMSLHDYVAAKGGIDEAETLKLMIPIVDALAMAHDQDIVHRDIKPSNIFLAEHSRRLMPKLIDFGVARELDASITTTSTLLGTLPYMSFELIKSARNASPSSDVYALGVTLFKLMTGTFPIMGRNLQEYVFALMEITEAPDLSLLSEKASPSLTAIVERCLQKEASARYPSAGALRDALKEIAESQPSKPAPKAKIPAKRPAPETPPPPPPSEAKSFLQRFYPDAIAIAEGPHATYFKGEDAHGAPVVIKTLGPAPTEEAREALFELGRSQKSLAEQCPFVRPIIEINEEANALSSPLPPGDTLGRYLEQYGHFDPTYVVELFIYVIDALRLAHYQGILHGHVHPGNIYLIRQPDGVITPQLFDFGHRHKLPQIHPAYGDATATYLAPEELGPETEPKACADVFGIGMCMFRAVTGKTPWECVDKASWAKALTSKQMLPDPRQIISDIPEVLSQVIGWCLAFNPSKRYQEVESLHRDLLAVRKQLVGY